MGNTSIEFLGLAVWSFIASCALAYVLVNRIIPSFPEVSEPVTQEEQRLREELAEVKSERDDLRTRLKHAIQDKERADRDAAECRVRSWRDIKKLRDIRRVLDTDADTEAVMLIGTEERAG